jgi:hypothetical protein
MDDVLDFLIAAVILVAYGALCAIIMLPVKKLIFNWEQRLRILCLSCFYAGLYGFGILSSGPGDPGFAFPLPILPATFISLWNWIPIKAFIFNIILPFTFWWFLILIVMMANHQIQRRRNMKKGKNKPKFL